MNEELDAFKSENKHTLGELLVRFLHYYSHFESVEDHTLCLGAVQ